jgi:hypothetical protein
VSGSASEVCAVTIVEDADFLAPELLDYRDFDRSAFDQWLPDNRIVIIAHQQDIGYIKTMIDFEGEFFDINLRADFSAVLASTSADNGVHCLISNLHLPPLLFHFG